MRQFVYKTNKTNKRQIFEIIDFEICMGKYQGCMGRYQPRWKNIIQIWGA